MSAQNEKIALFIDGANLYTTAKSLGLDIDYKRLLREFQSGGQFSCNGAGAKGLRCSALATGQLETGGARGRGKAVQDP